MSKRAKPERTVPPFHGNINFNAQHSPMGAFFSFTCGHFGTRGGFGLQIGKPGNQDLFIGVKDGDRFSDSPLKVLPFYQGAMGDEAKRYDVEGQSGASKPDRAVAGLLPYTKDQIKRHYGWATDRWVTEDFEFKIHTPFDHIDFDPRVVPEPAISAQLVIDNRHGRQVKTGVFAIRFPEPGSRLLKSSMEGGTNGFAWRSQFGALGWVTTTKEFDYEREKHPTHAIMRWDIASALQEINAVHHLGNVPGIAFEVPPGEQLILRLALGCFLSEFATTRFPARYAYARRFTSLEQVLERAMGWGYVHQVRSKHSDRDLLSSGLSPDQQFLIAHATRSYYGSTQLLDVGGEPFWVVNEGEYCMMNTLDLSVDHVFWELKQNPWVVKNLLDNFARHYSYVDQVKVPKGGKALKKTAKPLAAKKEKSAQELFGHPAELGATTSMDRFDLKPGGISFCHDMGVHNNFSPKGYSSYELPNIVGCFGYMTAEQLCNWSLMAACYVHATGDLDWLRLNQSLVEACLTSMINRGGEAGFCQFDSSRCETGAEITTYDSLDHSLAQTRNNVYMAIKSWATYLGLKMLLEKIASPAAQRAADGAALVEKRVLAHVGPDGVLPAVFERDNPGYHSRILPAVEGLIYPWFWKDPALTKSKKLVAVLKKHTSVLLKDPKRRNLFEDGGIRLSSTSNNSWMSKIALFIKVCRAVFNLDADPQIADLLKHADAAHVRWQTEGDSAYWACSDQIVNGVAKGSKYYPRIITAALWLS